MKIPTKQFSLSVELDEFIAFDRPEGIMEIIMNRFYEQELSIWQQLHPSETIKQQLNLLEKRILDEYAYYEKLRKRNSPYWFREMSAERIEDYIRKIKRLETRIYFLENPNKETEVTGQMIAMAKEYPIEKIIEVNGQEFALCPNHPDKHPSLWTKNNYAYCFACGYRADTIKLVMDIEKLSFGTAVKKLQCLT